MTSSTTGLREEAATYLHNLRTELSRQRATTLLQKAVKNPRLVFALRHKYRQQGRYEHNRPGSASYSWDSNRISGILSGFFDAERSEFQTYFDELSNSNALRQLEATLVESPYRSAPSEFGYRKILYAVARHLEPETIVETGVYDGVGSVFFLAALDRNDSGQPHSIDYVTDGTFPEELESGWVVPQSLKARWELINGRSINELEPLLDSVEQVDLFFHDSEHTYTNMMYEYRTVFRRFPEAVLMSDDVDSVIAFHDFTDEHGLRQKIIDNIGIGIKEGKANELSN
ncbi:MAG: class I SAM-dependent methyltransferase [Candidatus Nanohaloarchaea archaeon]|nr:class I SAM-dependent methyltransferase [Candidatus Nanohaloarchaea archaeon]